MIQPQEFMMCLQDRISLLENYGNKRIKIGGPVNKQTGWKSFFMDHEH